MQAELIYDKRNVKEIPGANDLILAELTKCVYRVFPKAEVKVKSMQANGINTNASKGDIDWLRKCLMKRIRGWLSIFNLRGIYAECRSDDR